MSSTQGHTNIHTVHTTVDISVLLGEINRIADESYSEGFESGYDVGMKKGRADAISEISREMRVLFGNEYEKQIRADAIEEFVTRFEFENITDRNSERLKPIIYEMHRLAEQMQKEVKND